MTSHSDSLTAARARRPEAGFTLIETLVAMGILTFGLLALAQVFVVGMTHMSYSSASIIAREKAREAIESVHTARDTRTITWAQIRNVAAGGVFGNAETPLLVVGPDGLVNTADDGPAIEALTLPGDDNVLGTADDVLTPLNGYFRRIVITDIAGTTTLRQLQVVMRYPVGSNAAPATCLDGQGNPLTRPGCYVLTTFISQFS
jgi:type II secretory pathway pseudopilin PulG